MSHARRCWTCWEGLVDRAQVGPEHKVLVHGGADGVGNVAVQIAVARGAHVYATAAPDKASVVEGLGATAIDYTHRTVKDYVAAHTGGEGFDIIYDTVGGPVLDASFAAARIYTGHVVSSLGFGAHRMGSRVIGAMRSAGAAQAGPGQPLAGGKRILCPEGDLNPHAR